MTTDMHFRIADSFTDSLAKLANHEQKAVKTTAFDLQLNPANPGFKFHKLNGARDPNFWSVRVSRDIRLIVHRTADSLLLCYVDHHDKAYRWAERRRLETHPRTGAAQFVEVRERVEEAVAAPSAPLPSAPRSAPGAASPPLFADVSDNDLLEYGVPADWLGDVRQATEDSLFEVAEHLPQEAAEALLDLATGVTPQMPTTPTMPAEADPFAHPDAQRRFRVMANVEELERALEFPWERWTVFLHPEQRRFVERSYNGPARIAGSAGTGKTIVALHRAVHLARMHPEARVLLTTFSKTLANSLALKLERLVGNEAAVKARIHVRAINQVGYELYSERFGQPTFASSSQLRTMLNRAAAEEEGGDEFSERFLIAEWTNVVDAWQLEDWEAYRDVPRLGRKTRLGAKQREALWRVFAHVRSELSDRGLVTRAEVFGCVTAKLAEGAAAPYGFAVVDEAQDMGVAEIRFLGALAGGRPDGLFFTGDLGQRIFQEPVSWRGLGVDIRGRSHTLRVNYRTSHQIRRQVDRLLPPALADVDGNEENRRGTVSVFNGPAPEVEVLDDEAAEIERVGGWIAARLADGVRPEEIGVFVRDGAQLKRARAAVKAAGVKAVELSDDVEVTAGKVALSTMHLAKGLEFRAAVVMACDDEVIPQQDRIEAIGDEADLDEVYATERHLLYVACTRARDRLLVTGVDPASEFLEDLVG